MAFLFNLIDDEGAKGLESYYQELIDKNVQGHFRYEAEMSRAFLSWRQGDGDAMKRYFSSAATEAVAQLSVFSNFGSSRAVTQFETALLIVNLFGSQQEKIKLSYIPRDAWFYPITPEYLPLADLLVAINRIFIENVIDNQIIYEIEQSSSICSANEFYGEWIINICYSLHAIYEKNEEKLDIGIQKILNLHEKETDEGILRNRVEAMVCLWACVICKIANNLSLKVNVESFYIPKQFI